MIAQPGLQTATAHRTAPSRVIAMLLAAFLLAAGANAQIYVSNSDGIVHVDVTTGDRSVVSGASTGAGPTLSATRGIGVLNESTAYVQQATDVASMQMLEIDIASGNRTLIGETLDSQGIDWYQAHGLHFDDSGNLYTYDDDVGFVVWPAGVDGVNSEQISYNPPGLGVIFNIVSNGTFAYVADFNLQLVGEIELSTTNMRVVTSSSVGSGDTMIAPYGIDFLDANTLVIAGVSTVMSVDIATGNRTFISGAPLTEIPVGSGPEFTGAVDVIAAPDDNIYVLDVQSESTIYAIDPVTGDRTILSGDGAGAGSGPVLSGWFMDYGASSGASDPIPTVPVGAPVDARVTIGLSVLLLLGTFLIMRRRFA